MPLRLARAGRGRHARRRRDRAARGRGRPRRARGAPPARRLARPGDGEPLGGPRPAAVRRRRRRRVLGGEAARAHPRRRTSTTSRPAATTRSRRSRWRSSATTRAWWAPRTSPGRTSRRRAGRQGRSARHPIPFEARKGGPGPMFYWFMKRSSRARTCARTFRPWTTGLENVPATGRGDPRVEPHVGDRLDLPAARAEAPRVLPREERLLHRPRLPRVRHPQPHALARAAVDRPVRRQGVRGVAGDGPRGARPAASCSASTRRAPAARTASCTAAAPASRG